MGGRVSVALVAVALAMGLPASIGAQDRASGFHLGGGLQAALLLGDHDLLDGGLGLEARGWQGFGRSGRLGLRVNLGFLALTEDAAPFSNTSADNTLWYLNGGPTLGIGGGPLFLYVHPSVGLAGSFQDYSRDEGPGGVRVTREEVDWNVVWGFSAGLRIFVTRGPNAVGLDLSGGFLHPGALSFARTTPEPTTTFVDSVTALGVSLGVTVRLP